MIIRSISVQQERVDKETEGGKMGGPKNVSLEGQQADGEVA